MMDDVGIKGSVSVILFGAGARGAESYGPFAVDHPEKIRFVAVAEPDPVRRERFAAVHGIPLERQYTSWEDVMLESRFADAVFNCTQDHMHHRSTLAALNNGYHVLLEKPICNTLNQTIHLIQTAEKQSRLLKICLVLQHTKFFQKIKEILQSRQLGELITISHRENVASWHMAHSYVRGNWRNESGSSPMILAKCCHDLDLLCWFVGEEVENLSSVGNLKHYRPENAPPGAPARCTDGCPVEDTCPYHAPSIYVEMGMIKQSLLHSRVPLYRLAGVLATKAPSVLKMTARVVPGLRELTEYQGWPRSVITPDPANENALMEALRTGPYGRCVYACDNDVVDHQVVMMNFKGGVSATLTMHGHSHEEGRTLRVDGSRASLLAGFGYSGSYIEIHDHRSMKCERYDFLNVIEEAGHGGGDRGVVEDFVQAMRERGGAISHGRESLESHMLAFAAEKARVESVVVDMEDFRRSVESSV